MGRGKRSICLDITKPEGLEVFLRLVDTADVVLGGFRKGVAERLGIGYEQLRERKPDIVYLAINAFGQDGDWSNRPGYEQNAQGGDRRAGSQWWSRRKAHPLALHLQRLRHRADGRVRP